MTLILIILVLFLIFGGSYYTTGLYGPAYGGGVGIVGIILILIVVYMLFGRGYF